MHAVLRCLKCTTERMGLVIEIMRSRPTERFTVFAFSPFLSTGYNCQVNINECASNPCLNQGTCFDDISGYTCHCVLPYTGESCRWRVQRGSLVLPCRFKPLSLRDGICGAVILLWGVPRWSPILLADWILNSEKHCGLPRCKCWGNSFVFFVL